MGISLAGLSSGLDTNALIDQLMAAERQPRTRLTLQQAAVQARQDALRQVSDKLKALKLAGDALGSVGTWSASQVGSSSDATIGGARVLAGAAPGTYHVVVSTLAAPEQRTYTYNSAPSDRTATINGKPMTITGGSSLDTVVNQINNDNTYGVYAVNAGGSLVLTARSTGQAITLSATGGVLNEQAAKAKPFVNATGTIDGNAFSSPTNTFSDQTAGATGAITGVELSLAKVGSYDATITPPQTDETLVTNKVKAFIDAYNAAVDLIQTKVSEKRVVNAATNADAAKGALWADSTLNNVLDSMRASMSTFMQSGNATSVDELAEIGISTGAPTGGASFSQDSVNGKLVFDATKFAAQMDGDPQSVQRLLGGLTGTDGFSQTFGTSLGSYTQAGGLLDSRIDAAGGEMTRLKDSLARMDDRLAHKQDYYQKMFTALEVALQKSQSQGAELLAKLGVSNDS